MFDKPTEPAGELEDATFVQTEVAIAARHRADCATRATGNHRGVRRMVLFGKHQLRLTEPRAPIGADLAGGPEPARDPVERCDAVFGSVAPRKKFTA